MHSESLPTNESAEIQSAYQVCRKLSISSKDINTEFVDIANLELLVLSAAGIGASIFSKQQHSTFAKQFLKQHVVMTPCPVMTP